MDHLEPLHGIPNDEDVSAVSPIAATGDFRFANRRRRNDSAQERRNGHELTAKPDDEVILSDVAHVSLLEQGGLSVSAIAMDLGLTAEVVLADAAIAAQICQPLQSAFPLGHAETPP